MKLTAIKEIREVVGADATNKLLQQGWVLLEVYPIHSGGNGGKEDGFLYVLGSAAGSTVPTE